MKVYFEIAHPVLELADEVNTVFGFVHSFHVNRFFTGLKWKLGCLSNLYSK